MQFSASFSARYTRAAPTRAARERHACILTTALLGILIATPSWTATGDPSAEWRKAAVDDLGAVHDILRDNSPAMIVDRDSAHFRQWLEQGFRRAHAGLSKVRSSGGYRAVMQYYIKGFRDGHVNWHFTDPSYDVLPHAWTGFAMRWSPNGYSVVYRKSGAEETPPLGARLIDCSGQSPARMIREHDLYDGNLQLASDRYWNAPELLFDRGNPFVDLPSNCRFRLAKSVKSYRLDWRPLVTADYEAIYAALGFKRDKALALTRWGEHALWMTVPTMRSDQDWNGFFAAVVRDLAAIRSADAVVIDLRGNQGGDSSFGDRLAALLWGEDFARAYQPRLGPVVWRVTQLNRDYWAELTSESDQDMQLAEADREEMHRVLERYDSALARGEPSFTDEDSMAGVSQPAGRNLMHGRVVLLTDYACASACLDLLDHFLAIPHVVQAGLPSGADTIFMELTRVRLPSGKGELGFGHKAYIERPRGSNLPYSPDPALTWTGPPSDEPGLRAWLSHALINDSVQ